MHPDLQHIPDRIIGTALGALRQANTQAVFSDPGMEHREYLCILSAALAGELFLKAIIAQEHPLLIFRDLFHLESHLEEEYDFNKILLGARTYTFDQLPKLLWVTTQERLQHRSLYEKVGQTRNAVQHFCASEIWSYQGLSLQFIYKIIDPLIFKHFGLCAIEYHEDFSVGYDYVVGAVMGAEMEFSIPPDFKITEIDVKEVLASTSQKYREGFGQMVLERLG